MRPWLTGLPYLADWATCLGGLPHLSCKHDQIKMRDYMERRVTPPRRATSPAWGPPPPCKQALTEHEVCTGEYWPLVIFVRTLLKLVRTTTTSSGYSPVWPLCLVSKEFNIKCIPFTFKSFSEKSFYCLLFHIQCTHFNVFYHIFMHVILSFY